MVRIMVGLRSPEEKRFEVFFELVQNVAKSKNSVFFLNCGEGHDLWKDDIICTDCSGWLIPNDKVEDFKAEFENFNSLDKWDDFTAWVTWKKNNGKIDVNIELL